MPYLNNSVKPYNDESLYSLTFHLPKVNNFLDFYAFCSGLVKNSNFIHKKI
jgi:hypothetical protein